MAWCGALILCFSVSLEIFPRQKTFPTLLPGTLLTHTSIQTWNLLYAVYALFPKSSSSQAGYTILGSYTKSSFWHCDYPHFSVVCTELPKAKFSTWSWRAFNYFALAWCGWSIYLYVGHPCRERSLQRQSTPLNLVCVCVCTHFDDMIHTLMTGWIVWKEAVPEIPWTWAM